MRRVNCILMVFVLVLSLTVPAWGAVRSIFTTATGYTTAEDVEYVTVNGTVVNWGARGEDATFLSVYAVSYYTDSYSWDTLSQLSGGTGTSDAYTSDLYDALQDMMKACHTTIQGYQDTRPYYQYTDCVSGDYSQISSFYSGKMVNGVWDGQTYNREHIWPKSKCINQNKKDDSADIMMLRPTVSSENSSRGNTAYGESSGFFDPGVDVHGDCARMVLYGYVRWGNTGYMWGSAGVMENLQILLKWMEEDPVDTWEMGRNDAVQSITGVRNVFVDYPEYAWLLFGQEIPENMVTPSGQANQEDTPPCNHTNTELRGAVAATCTTNGYTGETYCLDCGLLLAEGETIPATGHSYVNGVCTNCGERDAFVASGTCGDHLTWVLDWEGILTVSGSGQMHEYNDWNNQAPWADYREQILGVVLDGEIYIGSYAFWNCVNMVTFRSSHPLYVEAGSFQNCQSLKKITIYGFGEYAAAAFQGCKSLEEVTLEEGVTEIKRNAFDGCSSLRVVQLPESLETIQDGVFQGCSSLESITIPDGVTSIGGWAFFDCSSLKSITIPDGVTSMEWCVFRGCSSLESFTIPNSVTSIGDSAFYGCSALMSITIPDRVISIGNSAFYDCSSLVSVTIPNSLTGIGDSVFAWCSSLESITIPDSITSIGDSAFRECSSLTEIIFEGDAPSISDWAFYGVTATVCYPAGNDTWAEDVMNNYHGNLTWVVYGQTEPEILLGDVNGDEVVNYLDAMLTAQFYVGDIGEDGLNMAAADVNGDGAINYLDAMLIAQFYVGDIDAFPTGECVSIPGRESINTGHSGSECDRLKYC